MPPFALPCQLPCPQQQPGPVELVGLPLSVVDVAVLNIVDRMDVQAGFVAAAAAQVVAGYEVVRADQAVVGRGRFPGERPCGGAPASGHGRLLLRRGRAVAEAAAAGDVVVGPVAGPGDVGASFEGRSVVIEPLVRHAVAGAGAFGGQATWLTSPGKVR